TIYVIVLHPALEELLGGGIYAEYRTDDARLTIEIIKAAERHGAVCLNYVEVVDFQVENDRLAGLICEEKLTGERFQIAGKYVVNASGAWVEAVQKLVPTFPKVSNFRKGRSPQTAENLSGSFKLSERSAPLRNPKLFLSKGVHVVVSHERLPLRQSVYFDLPDGRMMFAIPRLRATYLGTTDTPFHGNPDHVFAENQDVAYILEGTNRMFPTAKLTFADVESTWAGLRPLIYEEGKSASEMSRKDEIFISPQGLISIAGGKLTGYRRMAERVVNLVAGQFKKEQGKVFPASTTDKIPLLAEPFSSAAEVAVFQKSLEIKVAELGLPTHFAAYLVENYGKDADKILAQTAQVQSALQVLTGLPNRRPDLALLLAELEYCFENEMVVKPLDFLERRTGRLNFNIGSIEPNLDEVLDKFDLTQEERAAVSKVIFEKNHF
ncbi:MAG: glycerol-3-phosphate dehydrogenase/oxidase, partial [Bacteroidota bacterium]